MGCFIDGHCDSATILDNGKLITGSGGHLDFPRLRDSHKAQFFAFFLNKAKYGDNYLAEMLARVAAFKKTVTNCDYVDFLLNKSDLVKPELLALLSLEGAEALDNRVELADIWFDLGFRSIGITWNNDNWAAGGCAGNNTGLTEAGYDLVAKLNDLNMIIDLAHSSQKTFAEVIAHSAKPVIVSHSCCYTLHNHRRNLTNNQLKILAEHDGICGINFYPDFLTGHVATIDDLVEHIHHAINIAGVEHVALGSDFDGVEKLPFGVNGVEDVYKIAKALVKRGYTENAVAKVMGGNWYRFLSENLP